MAWCEYLVTMSVLTIRITLATRTVLMSKITLILFVTTIRITLIIIIITIIVITLVSGPPCWSRPPGDRECHTEVPEA